MKNRSTLVLAGLCCSFVASAVELAPTDRVATLSKVNGQVLLTRGTRVGPAQAGTLLNAGDRLMTLERSDALIAFVDGCERQLESDALLTIGETSHCLAGRSAAVSFRQAIGEPGGAGNDDSKKAAPIIDASNASGTTSSTLTTGQKWTVAGVLLLPIIYYWDRNRDDDDRPPVSR